MKTTKRKRIDFNDNDQVYDRMKEMCHTMLCKIGWGMYFDDFKGVDDWGHLDGSRSLEEIFEASTFILSDKFDDEGMLTQKDMRLLYKELRKFEFVNGKIKYIEK